MDKPHTRLEFIAYSDITLLIHGQSYLKYRVLDRTANEYEYMSYRLIMTFNRFFQIY